MKEDLNVEKITESLLSKQFKFVFFDNPSIRGMPEPDHLYNFGIKSGLNDLESAIVSYIFHSIVVVQVSCYIKDVGLFEDWHLSYRPNSLFNRQGFKLFTKSHHRSSVSLLMISGSRPSLASTKEYKDFYENMQIKVDQQRDIWNHQK